MFQPFDVKELQLLVWFASKYPAEVLKVTLGENDRLPTALKRYVLVLCLVQYAIHCVSYMWHAYSKYGCRLVAYCQMSRVMAVVAT